jgi:tRNA(Ile)-lysidine synthase
MIERVAQTIERHRMLSRGQRLGIAVSGGADSVFLLHAVHSLSLAAAVLHINHNLRGVESDADEQFVRDLAASLHLPIHILNNHPDAGNLEQEARRHRYEFFTAQIAAGTCDAVATGHTLDDQAETVLYRFARGAGTTGLSGILPVTRAGTIRPLIELRRDDIRAWLTERKIPWREDTSNLKADFARNRIRLRHLPDLAASLNPAIDETLASTAEWARGEEDYWTAEVDRLEPSYLLQKEGAVLVSTGPFRELPTAVQRRLLRRAIDRAKGSLRSVDFHHVEAIRRMMGTREGSGRIQLPGLDVYRSFDWLRLAPLGYDERLPRDFEAALAVPGRTEVNERQLTIEMELVNGPGVYNDGVQALDWERCTGSLSTQDWRLRNWRPGDQYQPLGQSGAQKIKTLFQDNRVPLWERRRWPVVSGVGSALHGGTILWSRKFGVASSFAAGPESRKILVIREVAGK